MDESPPGLLKVCVFCGERPLDKTREHVLPRWLIELTGDPKRQARFDLDWSKKPPEFRHFSFDQFTVPACSTCNETFGSLEDETKPIMEKLLAADPLGVADFDVLLSWLDMVRIGLWLAKYLLDKNMFGIKPNFYIAGRIGASDRALIIFRHRRTIPRLSFIGTSTPCFQLNPVSVALLINDFIIISVAHATLCSRRLGFPYLELLRMHEEGPVEGRVRAGLERTLHPLLPHFPHWEGTGIYQPIVIGLDPHPDSWELFDSEYCRSNSLHGERGLGGIFQQTNGRVRRYSDQPNQDWVPRAIGFGSAVRIATNFVHGEQLRVLTQAVPLWPSAVRSHMRARINVIRNLHKHIAALTDETVEDWDSLA